MNTYAYEAMNSSGQEVTGEQIAESSEAAIAAIRQKGLFPTKVREKEKQHNYIAGVNINREVILSDRPGVLRFAHQLTYSAAAAQAQSIRLAHEAERVRGHASSLLKEAESEGTIKEGAVYLLDGKAFTAYRNPAEGEYAPLRLRVSDVVE
jgi:hypothetical protein